MPFSNSSSHRGVPPGGDAFSTLARITTAVTAATAAIGVGLKCYENHQQRYGTDRSRSSRHAVPRRLERQILAGSSEEQESECPNEDEYPTSAATNVFCKGDLTIDDLNALSNQYKDEIRICNELEDYERMTWLATTQKIITQVISMRNDLDHANQVGDYASITKLAPELQKMQKDLLRRQESRQAMDDEDRAVRADTGMYGQTGDTVLERRNSSRRCPEETDDLQASTKPSGADAFLSREELCDLRRDIDRTMRKIDTGSGEELTKWRTFNRRKKLCDEAIRIFDAIDSDNSSRDEAADDELREKLTRLQGDILGRPEVAQSQGFFPSVQALFGLGRNPNKTPRQKRNAPETDIAVARSKSRKLDRPFRGDTSAEGQGQELGRNETKEKNQCFRTKRTHKLVQTKEPTHTTLAREKGKTDGDTNRFSFDTLSPLLVSWNVRGEAPKSRFDLSDKALAFTAPNGEVTLPVITAIRSQIPGITVSVLRRFIASIKRMGHLDWSDMKCFHKMKQWLPSNCTLDEDQIRHLYRNFSDSRHVYGQKDEVELSRREFDIIMFCKARGKKISDALLLMPYRSSNAVEKLWTVVYSLMPLEIRICKEYEGDLKKKVGLLLQLEQHPEGCAKPITSRGRVTNPPTKYQAEPASGRGNDDTIAGPRGTAANTRSLDSSGASSVRDEKVSRSSSINSERTDSIPRKRFKSSRANSGIKEKESAPKEVYEKPSPELGEGWVVKGYARTGGESRGHIDRYYFSPLTKKRFRSKASVERFLHALEETNGDEDKAYLLATGAAARRSAKTIIRVNANANQDIDEEAPQEEYTIKRILARKYNSTLRRIEHLILWEGYDADPSDYTWEPIENLGSHASEASLRWGDTQPASGEVELNDEQIDSEKVNSYLKYIKESKVTPASNTSSTPEEDGNTDKVDQDADVANKDNTQRVSSADATSATAEEEKEHDDDYHDDAEDLEVKDQHLLQISDTESVSSDITSNTIVTHLLTCDDGAEMQQRSQEELDAID